MALVSCMSLCVNRIVGDVVRLLRCRRRGIVPFRSDDFNIRSYSRCEWILVERVEQPRSSQLVAVPPDFDECEDVD